MLSVPWCGLVTAAIISLAVGSSGEAAGRLVPVAGVNDLQNQVKTTASKVIPAVVSIASTVMVRDQAFSDETLPFGLFKEPPARRQYGQGSGVIVSSDGYIITNNHVVADAVDVEVILADRRQFKGKVVATDPKTDVAVVKIQSTNLPTVPWGDSSNLAVGDFVLAIGNPLGIQPHGDFRHRQRRGTGGRRRRGLRRFYSNGCADQSRQFRRCAREHQR